jgi:hypothetical protein
MSGHVSYEFQMIVEVGSKLIDNPLNPDPVIHNALVESFLLHLRQAHQFLAWNTAEKANAVLAVDFIPGWADQRGEVAPVVEVLEKDVEAFSTAATGAAASAVGAARR